MNKEKIAALKRYLEFLTQRLNSPVPEKHQSHPDTYLAFLNNEIRLTKARIEKGNK